MDLDKEAAKLVERVKAFEGREYRVMSHDPHKGPTTRYLDIVSTGKMWDSGWCRVEVDNIVRYPDGTAHPITAEENQLIQDIADWWSSCK